MPIILECVLRAAGNETHTERERHAKRESERTKCARCRDIQITDWSMRDADSRCYNSNNTPSRIAVVLSGQT